MQSPENERRANAEVRELAREIEALRDELRRSRPAEKASASIFHSPALLAIIGILGTIATGLWQLHANRELEREKLRSSLIQEASKSGNPETTLKNLQFLVKAGVLRDENGWILSLKPGDVPYFAQSPVKPTLSPQDTATDLPDPRPGWR